MNNIKFEKLNRSDIDETSLITLPAFIFVFLIAAVLCTLSRYEFVGMVLFVIVLLGILSRAWTRLSEKKCLSKIELSKTSLFPGDKSKISFIIDNKKALPLSYVEISKPMSNPPIFSASDLSFNDSYGLRCSLIKGYEKSKFTTNITALSRGIDSLLDMHFYTGDPFGLSRINLKMESSSAKEIVVYPKTVLVKTEKFTRNMWEGERNSKGVLEDTSVIKLTRPYEEKDSLKSINFRLLARGEGLVTNQFEVINPKRVHFIFDGHSFNTRFDELENALSILASLTLSLEQSGLYIGFSFPKTARLNAINIRGNEGSSIEGLYRMAEFTCYPPENVMNVDGNFERKFNMDSKFNDGELIEKAASYGKLYFITYDEESKARSELLKSLSTYSIEPNVLTYDMLKEYMVGGNSNA